MLARVSGISFQRASVRCGTSLSSASTGRLSGRLSSACFNPRFAHDWPCSSPAHAQGTDVAGYLRPPFQAQMNVGRFMLRGHGYKLQPHVDALAYLVTALYYFPQNEAQDDPLGTTLYRVEGELGVVDLFRREKTKYFHKAGIAAHPAAQIPFVGNALLAFPKHRPKRAWHAHYDRGDLASRFPEPPVAEGRLRPSLSDQSSCAQPPSVLGRERLDRKYGSPRQCRSSTSRFFSSTRPARWGTPAACVRCQADGRRCVDDVPVRRVRMPGARSSFS